MKWLENLGPRGFLWAKQKKDRQLPMRTAHLNVRKNLDTTFHGQLANVTLRANADTTPLE